MSLLSIFLAFGLSFGWLRLDLSQEPFIKRLPFQGEWQSLAGYLPVAMCQLTVADRMCRIIKILDFYAQGSIVLS